MMELSLWKWTVALVFFAQLGCSTKEINESEGPFRDDFEYTLENCLKLEDEGISALERPVYLRCRELGLNSGYL